MEPILQAAIPADQLAAAADPIPRVRPVEGPWLTVDDAYSAQIALRRRLLSERRAEVLAPPSPEAAEALHRGLIAALRAHPAFRVEGEAIRGPVGPAAPLRPGRVLEDAAAILSEDLCLIARQPEGGHVLSAALLCFPASWTLAEKIGRPLGPVHGPVTAYDGDMARRVDRLFDGVTANRPLWRANLHRYADPALHHPRRETDPQRIAPPDAAYLRSERQTILRLTPGLVLFAIHTCVIRA